MPTKRTVKGSNGSRKARSSGSRASATIKGTSGQPEKRGAETVAPKQKAPLIIVHGGGWYLPDAIVPRALAGVRRAATAGWIRMSGKQAAWSHEFGAGASDDATGAVEAVEAAVRVLEDDPSFNAGRGSSLTTTGIVQCDASVCCGHRLSAGAVCGISIARNPVSVARLVMESTKHVLLCGEGANAFAKHIGADLVEHGALVTPEARQRLAAARERTSLASFLRENRLVYGRVLPGAAHPSALPAGHVAVAGSEHEQVQAGESLKQPAAAAAAAGQSPMEVDQDHPAGTDHSGGENGVGSNQTADAAGAAEGEGEVHAHNQSTARMAATVAAAAAVSAIQEAAPIAVGGQSPAQGDGTTTGMPPPPTAGQGQQLEDAMGMSAAEEQTAVVAAVAAATSAVAGATEGLDGPGGLSISATHASSSSSSSSSAGEFPPTDADADGIGMISVNDSLESYEEEAQLAEAQLRSGYGHRTTMHQRRRRRTADRVLGQGRRTTARRRAAAAQQQVARVAAAAATAAVRAVASHRRRVQRSRGSATSAAEATGQAKAKADHRQSKGKRAASNGKSNGKAKLPAKRARRASSKDSSKSPAADAAEITPKNPPKRARTMKTNGSAPAAHEQQPKKDAAGVMYADALKAGVADIDGPGDGACTDTVGAVALDLQGHVASATSTGGITNKLLGRVGDSPLVGAGGFADDWSGAVSATGFGEAIMRVSLARRVAEGLEAGRCGWRVPHEEVEAGKQRAGARGQGKDHRDDGYPWERDSDSESEAPQPGSMAQFEARLAKGRGKAGARVKGKGKARVAEGGSGAAGHVEPTVGTPTVSSQAGDSDGNDGDGNDRGDASESSSAWTDDLSAGMDAAHPRRAIRRALGYLLHRVRGASGVIALDRNGRWAVGHSTRRIAWAAVTPDGVLYSGISAADDQALPPPDPVQPVELKLALRGRGQAGEQEQLID